MFQMLMNGIRGIGRLFSNEYRRYSDVKKPSSRDGSRGHCAVPPVLCKLLLVAVMLTALPVYAQLQPTFGDAMMTSDRNTIVNWTQPTGVVVQNVSITYIWTCAAGSRPYTLPVPATPPAGATTATVAGFTTWNNVGCPENANPPNFGNISLGYQVNGTGPVLVVSRSYTFGAATPPGLLACTLAATPSSISAGSTSTLTASCSPGVITEVFSYAWSGGTCAGTSAATCVVTPSASTTYTVAGINSAGTGASARATVTVAPRAPNPSQTVAPPPANQSAYTVTTGQMPTAAVTTTATGTLGNATLIVTLDLSRILSGGSFAAQGQFAAGYNIYVFALLPSGVLGLASPTFITLSATRGWTVLSLPVAAYMEGLAQNATNLVQIEILRGLDVTGLVGTEFYVGYGTSDTEMLTSGRYRGVYKVQ